MLLWGGSSQTVFACDRYLGSRLGQKAQDRVVVGYAPPKPKQNGAVKSVEREKGLVGTTNFQVLLRTFFGLRVRYEIWIWGLTLEPLPHYKVGAVLGRSESQE